MSPSAPHSTPPPDSPNLGASFLRTVHIFQALVASPILFFLGFLAFVELFHAYTQYDFIANFCNALMAAGIVFLVFVQRKIFAPPSRQQAAVQVQIGDFTPEGLSLLFEVAKAVLATAMWIWLLLDSAVGPNSSHDRVVTAVITVVLLLVLFYPTVVYTAVVWKGSKGERGGSDSGRDTEAARNERTPLLEGQ